MDAPTRKPLNRFRLGGKSGGNPAPPRKVAERMWPQAPQIAASRQDCVQVVVNQNPQRAKLWSKAAEQAEIRPGPKSPFASTEWPN
ncbi:MAG: hypothetical protein V4712_01570 [Pseudomonadota bacterium]